LRDFIDDHSTEAGKSINVSPVEKNRGGVGAAAVAKVETYSTMKETIQNCENMERERSWRMDRVSTESSGMDTRFIDLGSSGGTKSFPNSSTRNISLSPI
jgi:hypothetical protein